MKFKPGDRIVVLNNSSGIFGNGSSYVKGQIYVVKSCSKDHVNTVRDSKGSTTNGWGINNFRLVKTKNLPEWW